MQEKSFWQGYCAVVLGNGLSEARAEWFMKWAQSWPDKVITIRAYEAAKELKYASNLKQRGVPQGKTFRDGVTSKEVNARYETVLERLRTEMRMRHHSLRTEQAYEHWLRRFVTFHGLKSPSELGPDAVREYLEYLARERGLGQYAKSGPECPGFLL